MTAPAHRLAVIRAAIHEDAGLWLAITVGITVAYHALLLLALVVRFGDLPNYWTFYDWPSNVWTIIVSTPSVSDMLPIIAEEWLIEIGFMNYDFGNGISEWALNVVPSNMAVVALAGGLVATHVVLFRRRTAACRMRSTVGAAGTGGLLVALTSATMSWVVCCATPTWVVGLSMLGLGASTALAVEPAGPWLAGAGFLLLAGGLYAGSAPERRNEAPTPRGLLVERSNT